MSEIKNKIITISGEPVSGKSTVVKKLKEKYEEMGYNVHLVFTGHLFRDIIMEEYRRMYPDRKDAKLADVQADETFASKIRGIDKLVDEEMRKKGIEINSKERPNDVYIIDSRLAWHNIPVSYAVRLTVDEEIAGERAFADETRGPEDRYETVEEAIKMTRERKLGEIERYKKRYGVDLSNPENYDLIVDTAYSNISELADIVIAGEKAYREGKEYPKMWASPAQFISVQPSKEFEDRKHEIITKSIKEDGYNLAEGTIHIAECDEVKMLLDGNHRTCAALANGKTLVPYKVIHKDDEKARENLQILYDDICMECIYDWAYAISLFGGKIGGQEQFKDFSIEKLTSYQRKIKPIIDKKKEEIRETKTVPVLDPMHSALLKGDIETYLKLLKELNIPSSEDGR